MKQANNKIAQAIYWLAYLNVKENIFRPIFYPTRAEAARHRLRDEQTIKVRITREKLI